MNDMYVSRETLLEIQRRFPDETGERNLNEPHTFTANHVRTYPTRWGQTEGTLVEGWGEQHG